MSAVVDCPTCKGVGKKWQYRTYGDQQYHGHYFERCDDCAGTGKVPMTTEPEFVAEDGTVRKAHYGTGRQPWDEIVTAGWGAVFAAANVLKYVRRHTRKNGSDDLQKARWYYARLNNMAGVDAALALAKLHHLLTSEELALL